MLGTYALSSGYYDAYYGQAQKVRTLITRDFAAAFETGRRAGLADHADRGVPDRRAHRRPVPMYLADLYTIPTNLSGGRRISVPVRTAPRGCRSACRSWRRRWPTTGCTGSAAALEAARGVASTGWPALPDAVRSSR